MRIAVCFLCLCAAAAAGSDLFNKIEESHEIEKVSIAKQAAERLLSAIRSKEFHAVLDIIGVVGGPIAGSVTSILKVIIGKEDGESEALKFVREAFEEINNKLESFTHEFGEIKSMIDWNAVQISFGTYERSIRALKSQLKFLVDAPRISVEHYREMFIIKYESSFQNAAEKIYDSIINNDLIFSRNLLEASAKYTMNHRKNVQVFGMGLTQLLLQAIEVNMAYIDLKFATEETTNHMRQKWNDRMLVLKAKLESFDEKVKSRGSRQIKEDAERVRSQNKQLASDYLALSLYYFLEDKFYWRKFSVAVYDDVNGEDKHSMSFCDGYTSLNRDGKNIVIASVDKDRSIFSEYRAERLVSYLEPTEKEASHILSKVKDAAGEWSTCNRYHLKLVTVQSANTKVAYHASSGVMKSVCVSTFWGTTCYWVILFG